ncbi:MAG TPA: hypothetical protein VHZ54_17130 [Solirubrobacterales bacterium]|nr:hypothetical protein [Solirubrobacterales bacterium]
MIKEPSNLVSVSHSAVVRELSLEPVRLSVQLHLQPPRLGVKSDLGEFPFLVKLIGKSSEGIDGARIDAD